MWLLPLLSRVATIATRTFYRLTVAGERVPPGGPVLLVANHPNSLLDPALAASAAGRPVRFLAKAPLFRDPAVGWLVRASGAVPVYRRTDDPALMERNDDTFRAAHDALAGGAAVGIFPEGVSHSEPSLAPLKTGAARIALGAAARLGAPFPIVPVGLTFRGKERFRSEALVLVGESVAWDDLAAAGDGDAAAVRELTRRIGDAMRRVTVNLEQWEDAPLVEWAEAIYAAEYPADPRPAARVARIREATGALARLRRDGTAEWASLAREITGHARLLRVLGLRPHELHDQPRLRVAADWLLRQAAFFLLGAPIAALGAILFVLPYRLTGIAEARARPQHDIRATYKVLAGALVHAVWIVLLATGIGWIAGPLTAAAAVLLLPPIGVVTLRVFDRWERAAGEARRFLVRTRRSRTLAELRTRQREIAARLAATRSATLL